jgi:hypothetical protein
MILLGTSAVLYLVDRAAAALWQQPETFEPLPDPIRRQAHARAAVDAARAARPDQIANVVDRYHRRPRLDVPAVPLRLSRSASRRSTP